MVDEVWVVDLDQTLVDVDTGIEGVRLLAQRAPWALVWACLVYFIQGIAGFKRVVCQYRLVDVTKLNYHTGLLALLKKAKHQGHRVILATASHRITADAVSNFLGIFDEVIATTTHNLKGQAKTAAIQQLIGAETPFIYWGDSEADYAVWSAASRIGVMRPSDKMLQKLQDLYGSDRVVVFR